MFGRLDDSGVTASVLDAHGQLHAEVRVA